MRTASSASRTAGRPRGRPRRRAHREEPRGHPPGHDRKRLGRGPEGSGSPHARRAPVKAALRGQIAVAIGILTVAPIRLGNLARIRLEENLIRPSGPLSPYWLVFPNYDVKNPLRLKFDLKERLTQLIEEYVHEHRPVLMRGFNEPWLFPGESGRHKTLGTLGDQITDAVWDRVGIRVTAHQYRHAAAAIIIKTTQDYELARRVLGHKNLATTTKFYLGLDTIHATERFGDIIRAQLSKEALEGVASW